MFTKWKKIERNSFNLLLQTNPYSSLTVLENIQPWEVGGGEMTQTETDTNTLRHSPVLGTTGKQNSRTLLWTPAGNKNGFYCSFLLSISCTQIRLLIMKLWQNDWLKSLRWSSMIWAIFWAGSSFLNIFWLILDYTWLFLRMTDLE